MKRMLGVLALALMVGLSMPAFAQDTSKGEAKKGTPAAEKKTGQEGDAKKAENAKKGEKKGGKKGAKKGDQKSEKATEKTEKK
jgi:Ni/Co efflux regulator RcnB